MRSNTIESQAGWAVDHAFSSQQRLASSMKRRPSKTVGDPMTGFAVKVVRPQVCMLRDGETSNQVDRGAS
jgi:hypothetical protein